MKSRAGEKRKHGAIEGADFDSPMKQNAKQRRAAYFKDFKKEYQGEQKGHDGPWRGQAKFVHAKGKQAWKKRG